MIVGDVNLGDAKWIKVVKWPQFNEKNTAKL